MIDLEKLRKSKGHVLAIVDTKTGEYKTLATITIYPPIDATLTEKITEEEIAEYCRTRNCTIVAHEDLVYLRSINSKRSQWIPVSERLPDHDECIKNNRMFNVSDGNRSYSEWFDYDKQKFGEDTMAGFRVDYAVIAWMPLPEPPEVKRNER